MKKIKWGIIGTGNIASKFATALNSMEDIELAAVASRDFDRARGFAERFQVQKAYDSYEEMAKAPDIDVVYIATPHSEHKAHATLCLNNNKAVLCEKSITINSRDTQDLIAVAKERNLFLMEAMWTKFLPVTKAVKHWIEEGRIGEIKHMKISFGFQKEFDINSRLYNPNTAGGALLDVGIYPITYAIHMLGRLPDRIKSSAVLGKSGVDEQNIILFEYNDGILADLSSAISVQIGYDALIIGDRGSIFVPRFWMAEKAMLYNLEGTLVDSISFPFKANGYEHEAAEVNRCLREGITESPVVPLQDTLDIMKIMDELRAQWGLIYPQENK